jgi:hypothetical protein
MTAPIEPGPVWQREKPRGKQPAPPPRRPRPEPGRAASTFAQLPFVRTASPERRREWHRIIVEARERAQKRRERVLAHPEIAERLKALGYRTPELWSGYVPPDEGPVRRELIDIMRAVVAAEGGGDG